MFSVKMCIFSLTFILGQSIFFDTDCIASNLIVNRGNTYEYEKSETNNMENNKLENNTETDNLGNNTKTDNPNNSTETDLHDNNAGTDQSEKNQQFNVNYEYKNQSSQDMEVSYEEAYQKINEVIDLGEIDRQLEAEGYGSDWNMTSLVESFVKEDGKKAGRSIGGLLQNALVSELRDSRELLVSLIVVVMLGSVFTRLALSYANQTVSENGFYITYLLITSITLTAFMISYNLIVATMERLITLIRIIIPAYMVAMNFVGHVSAAAGTYQLVLIAIWIVQAVLLRIVVPLIKYYVIIALINNLNKEEYFSKFAELLVNVISYILKITVIFIAGLNLIKGLLGPQLDMLGKTSVNRFVTAIPGGGVVSILTGTFLAAGMVIKNSIGIAAICLVLSIVAAPLVKLFVIKLLVKLVAALVQPIGDKRYVEGIDSLSNGLGLLLKVLYSSVVMFVLIIAVMAFTTNSL